MILVTVGTEKFSFNRLMTWIDCLIDQGFLNLDQEDVIVQYGSCTIQPKGVKAYTLLPETEFKSLVAEARLIISHCGEGSVDLLATTHKPFILVPRSHQFGEHVDDHQVELAEQLADRAIPIAYTLGDLVRFLQAPQAVKVAIAPTAYYAQASRLLERDFSVMPKVQSQPVFAWTNFVQNMVVLVQGLSSAFSPN